MTIGARTIKTGLAVALSIYICNFFGIVPSIFAGMAAVLVIQPSIGLSFVNAMQQVLVHFFAISTAIILGFSFGSHPLSMALAAIIIILICQHFNWQNSILGGIMATIFVLASPSGEFLTQSLIRSLAIFIGVGVGLLINAIIVPPRLDQSIQEKFLELNKMISQSFFQAVQSYLSLAIPTKEDVEFRKKTVEAYFRESQRIYEMYLIDKKISFGGKGEASEEYKENKGTNPFADYLIYNKGLWQKTLDIFVLAEQRRDRRKEAGDLPLSPEFQEIMEMLKTALEQYNSCNQALQDKLSGKSSDHKEEAFMWGELDLIINRWQKHFPSGLYYLYALIGVSLVVDKIRWAETEALRLGGLEYTVRK